MSRSGYDEDFSEDNYSYLYRYIVDKTIKGKRGQALLKELAAALDAMPEKLLILENLVYENEFCALGIVCHARGMNTEKLNNYENSTVAKMLNIPKTLADEITYINDEYLEYCPHMTPEKRWVKVRKWVSENLIGNER